MKDKNLYGLCEPKNGDFVFKDFFLINTAGAADILGIGEKERIVEYGEFAGNSTIAVGTRKYPLQGSGGSLLYPEHALVVRYNYPLIRRIVTRRISEGPVAIFGIIWSIIARAMRLYAIHSGIIKSEELLNAACFHERIAKEMLPKLCRAYEEHEWTEEMFREQIDIAVFSSHIAISVFLRRSINVGNFARAVARAKRSNWPTMSSFFSE